MCQLRVNVILGYLCFFLQEICILKVQSTHISPRGIPEYQRLLPTIRHAINGTLRSTINWHIAVRRAEHNIRRGTVWRPIGHRAGGQGGGGGLFLIP